MLKTNFRDVLNPVKTLLSVPTHAYPYHLPFA